jgi:AcrR family transcriptional regulator
MSREISEASRRGYRKRRRAEQEEETRRRITEATVELHGSVGPARTSVSAVAERAGVQRATVYRHFPDEGALIDACSAHWTAANPRPDLASWAAIDDPEERLRTGLAELYAWFDRTEYMVEKIVRDAATVPALHSALARTAGWFLEASEALLRGRGLRGRRRVLVKVAFGHALAFETWRSLVRHGELPPETAIELMAALVAAAETS